MTGPNVTTSADLTPAQKDTWQKGADIIRAYEKKSVESAAEIGAKLIEMKHELGHGHFGHWLKHVGWNNSTAENHMNLSRNLGDKIPTVGNLKLGEVYKIAALPDDHREKVLNLITDPENPPVAAIKEQITVAQNEKRLARMTAVEQAVAARKTPAAKKAAEAREKKNREQAEAEQRARDEATEKLQAQVAQWIDKLAPDMAAELTDMLNSEANYRLDQFMKDALTQPGNQVVQITEVTLPKKTTSRAEPECEDAVFEPITDDDDEEELTDLDLSHAA